MLRPVKNEQQYEQMLERVYELMQKEIKPDSKDSDVLIKEYEKIVGYTVQCEPLTKSQYIKKIKQAEKDIEDGKFTTH